jgi:hypothetical protein
MSSLSSSSTLAQIKAAYADNASYEEDDSVSKARAFVTACRLLMLRLPSMAEQVGHSKIEQDVSQLRKELEAAQSYIATASEAQSQVIHADFGGFRD